MEPFIFVSVPIKGVFWQFEWSWVIEFGKVHYLFGKNIYSECQNNPFIGTKTKMNDSIFLPVKSSYIFGKQTWKLVQYLWRYDKKKLKNQVRKTHNWCNQKDNGFLPNLIVQLLPIITPLILDQLTWNKMESSIFAIW